MNAEQLNTYNNGPEGMPRVERMTDSTIGWLMNELPLLNCLHNERSYEEMRQFAHVVAEEVLARVPAWPIVALVEKAAERAVSPAESVQSIDTPEFHKLLNAARAYRGTEYSKEVEGCLIVYVNAKLAFVHAEGRRSAMEELAKEKERADEAERALKVVQEKNVELARQCDGVLALEIELAALRAARQAPDLAKLTRYGDNDWAASADPEFGPKEGGDYVRFADVQALLSSTAKPLQQEGGKEVPQHGIWVGTISSGDIEGDEIDWDAEFDSKVLDALPQLRVPNQHYGLFMAPIDGMKYADLASYAQVEVEDAAPQPSDNLQQASTAPAYEYVERPHFKPPHYPVWAEAKHVRPSTETVFDTCYAGSLKPEASTAQVDSSQQWGYVMIHKTTGERGFSWKRDDPAFPRDWRRVPMVPATAYANKGGEPDWSAYAQLEAKESASATDDEPLSMSMFASLEELNAAKAARASQATPEGADLPPLPDDMDTVERIQLSSIDSSEFAELMGAYASAPTLDTAWAVLQYADKRMHAIMARRFALAASQQAEPVAQVAQEAFGRGQVAWLVPASAIPDGTLLYRAAPPLQVDTGGLPG